MNPPMQPAAMPNRIPSSYSTRNSGLPRTVPLRRTRFWLVCLFFIVWLGSIAIRLFWLQIVHHHDYLDRAQKQQQRTFEVAPRRGILYDRNLHELAMTVQVDSIYAVPTEIENKKAAASTLASIVHTDPVDVPTSEDQIAVRLAKNNGFAWIARRVSPDVSAKIKALNLKGIYFQKEFQRSYPNTEIAAQVLGYVGIDDTGLGGIEQKFEPQLHGVPGRMYTAMDARRHILGSTESEPQPGQNLVLSIDEQIQFMAEQALDHVMDRTHADNGTIVIQDVHTGQILALAIRPTFNPNQFRRTTPALLRDHAVSDVYEPGSTFKLVAYSAAMDAGVAKPDDTVDCQGGLITLAGRVIHDNQGEHPGVIPVHKALEISSDVGAIKMALKVGQDRYSEYVRSFGFGSRSGVELPGETRGLLRPVSKWGPSSIGSIAMGQEIAVTPVQLVSMVSTIANGGIYLPPHVLMSAPQSGAQPAAQLQPSPFKPGGQLPNPLPTGAHRVISTMAAAQMRQMMEGVILYGTGKDAQLNGYSAGGKTGTAQKIDPATHKYSKTMHVASFAGIAPVNNPVIAVAIVMDNPKAGGSYYGAAVSAPVFQEVAQQVLEYLGVQHDEPVHAQKTPPASGKSLAEDDHGDSADVNALYAAINDLPSDDPLRQQPAQQAITQPNTPTQPAAVSSAPVQNSSTAAATPASSPAAAQPPQSSAAVIIPTANTLKVPSLIGLPMRQVIVAVGDAGLEVQVIGSGTVREQAPAAGTMVPPGTRIVVHCAR
ncbi:penicillin-binding protein [Terracidiphilus gabretensis]|uniref:penicillin-binding protein n=1 Tax=Terracidiphilus gabretensis TaxID=1577687 RepID=UPI002F42D33B